MTLLHPFFAVLATVVALGTCFLFLRRFQPPDAAGRYRTIDGLRGYLAFSVFLHHSVIWYFYLQTGTWKVPPSNFYTHLGQTSVVVFFMITGFLFYTKLIDSSKHGINWTKFYISRFFRLAPLYFFSISLLFLICIYKTNGLLHEPLWDSTKAVIKWITFTMLGAPNINGVEDTGLIMAGVTWSLPYEWFFYLALPLIGTTVRCKTSYFYLFISACGIAFSVWYGVEAHHLLAFFGGIASAILIRENTILRFSTSNIASILALTCLALTFSLFPDAYGIPQLALLSIAFMLIAGGCDLFGLLKLSVSTMLGELSYSIYLLHGIVLYVLINFIIGAEKIRFVSPTIYALLIIGITPFLILASATTFSRIEKPWIKMTERIMKMIEIIENSHFNSTFGSIKQRE